MARIATSNSNGSIIVEQHPAAQPHPRDFIGYGRHKPRVVWPNGAAVAVNFCVAYEEGAERSPYFGDEMGESLGPERPTVPGLRELWVESVFEYGSRSGIWRLAEVFEQYDVPATLFAAATALERNPEVCAWVRERNHDICCHGWRWIEPWLLDEEVEREHIRRAVQSVQATCGSRPIGWRSRTGASLRTRALLVEEGGFLYDSDAYNDDLPYWTSVSDTKHLVVPYTLTYTEGRLVQPLGYTSPAQFWQTCADGLEQLRREGQAGFPKMMSIGLHPRHTGQAGRVRGFREFVERALRYGDVWFATRRQIAEHWRDNWHTFDV